MERVKMLEEEQEMLNSSLIALTTHFAQVKEETLKYSLVFILNFDNMNAIERK